ncbi:MEX3C ligase, partial [Polyodon spathula]|nr:MEX3C ligase [Polyodon spathula]
MPSSLYHPDIMEGESIVSSHHGGGMTAETGDGHQRDEQHQEALRFALDQLSLIGLEDRGECGGTGETDPTLAGQDPALAGLDDGSCNGVGVGFIGLQMMEHPGGPSSTPTSCSPPPDIFGPGFHMAAQHQHSILGEQVNVIGCRKRSVNMTECVPVPSSEHVAEIVGRQGCKIKALRAKTNTYIKTPVRGEEPMFIVTGRKEDVEMAKREILSAAEHFSMIRASRNKASAAGLVGAPVPGPPNLPGQTTIQVRVPYRVVGLVVGPKGATIKRIQQQTHTYIVTPSRDKDPVFEVTGMPENVDRAREEIETHITLRTGAFVDLQGDNDFHSNGTDVSLDASESHYSSAGGRVADTSPTSPFSTGSTGGGGAGGGFVFGGDPHAAVPPADDLGFEFTSGAGNIWAPFVNGLSRTTCQQQQQQRRNSGLSAGALTPRLSPTLPESVVLDHPLARRAQSSLSSAASGGSPTDSEGGVLGRLKSARECSVCFESEVTAALVPCGHNLFCMECAAQICKSAEPECPICHTPATQAIRCKIKALRAKTNTYIKTPVRGEEPMFIVTGRKEDVEMAKREILSAAEHFSMIRASRNKASAAGLVGAPVPGPPNLPGQTTIQVRVPYRVVGLVVGPKGATIKRIQQQTHTYIVTPSRDKDPVFEVTGMPENVDRAREEIETHITLRTGAFVDLQGDNDFHSNGTDVSLDASGLMVGAGLWARPTNSGHGATTSATRKIATAAFRNGSLSSLGSGSTESHYSSAGGRVADTSPTSPFSTGSAGGGGAGGGFVFGGDPHAAVPPADDLGFEFTSGAGNIWAPFVNGLSRTTCQQQQQQRRNSGLSAGALTPRLSPTLPESVVLDHPLARRAQSDPLSAISWLHSNGSAASSFSGSTTGYSSASSLPGSLSSAASGGSPTDSEGGVLGRLKSARECSVCFESEVTAALVPCGHNLFCMECAAQICKSAEPECPICHTPATQAIRILL